YAWGLNSSGQIGDGTTTGSNVPVKVSLPGGVGATKVAAGQSVSLAIGVDGNLYSWGKSSLIGRTGTANVPGQVSLPAAVTATDIAEGAVTSHAVGSDGSVYSWGGNQVGQIGNGTTTGSSVPVKVSVADGVAATAVAE